MTYRFGDYELDTQLFELRAAGTRPNSSPKCLICWPTSSGVTTASLPYRNSPRASGRIKSPATRCSATASWRRAKLWVTAGVGNGSSRRCAGAAIASSHRSRWRSRQLGGIRPRERRARPSASPSPVLSSLSDARPNWPSCTIGSPRCSKGSGNWGSSRAPRGLGRQPWSTPLWPSARYRGTVGGAWAVY